MLIKVMVCKNKKRELLFMVVPVSLSTITHVQRQATVIAAGCFILSPVCTGWGCVSPYPCCITCYGYAFRMSVGWFMEAVSRLPELSFRSPGFTNMQFQSQLFCKTWFSTAASSRTKRVGVQSYGYRCQYPPVVTSCHRNGCLSKVFHPAETPKDFVGWIFLPSAQPSKELLAKRVAW